MQRDGGVEIGLGRLHLHGDGDGLGDFGGGFADDVAADTRFKGRVAVLIDELTYSAGILFATTMQDHKLATVVGRPTGGFANQTDNMMPTRLPATGFTAFIAQPGWIERQLDAPAS